MPTLSIHLPDQSIGNPYQSLLAKGISQHDVEVHFENFPESAFPLNSVICMHPTAKVLHLHWIHPLLKPIMWSGSDFKAWVRLCRLLLDVLIARARGVMVVWTVHNLIAHESPNARRELVARRWLARCVSHLIFHSRSAEQQVMKLLGVTTGKKSSIVPHGNYINVYPKLSQRESELREELKLEAGEIVILFFGAVRRYKGVGTLIEAFSQLPKKNIRLIIAGRAFEDSLATELHDQCSADSRIHLRLGFVPECDVAALHAISNIVAIPFERTLTSGSAILAASLGKALLLPDDARVIELPSFNGTIFFDSVLSLTQAIESLDLTALGRMGELNLSMMKSLDWSVIGRSISLVYFHHHRHIFNRPTI